MKKLLQPWIFVLIGIVFNIGAAVVTHYFVGLNNEQIQQIQARINSKQVLIDSLWQGKTELERKHEFFLLYLNRNGGQSPVDAAIGDYIRQQLGRTVSNYALKLPDNNPALDSPQINAHLLAVNAAAQKHIIASINDSYLEKLELEQSRQPLEQHNALLYSIAIFLQVTGLILVLARDLRIA